MKNLYRTVFILASAEDNKEKKQAKPEAATPKKSEKTFGMGQGSVYEGGKCSKWDETLTMKQETEKVENNAELMHRITVELRKKHTSKRVKSVDILFDGKMAARKITANVTFIDIHNATHIDCIIFKVVIDDINECELGIHKCLDKHMICINTPGSYQCQCQKGYKLDHDCTEEYLDNDKCKANQVCVDIDECVNYTDNKCPNNTRCINTEGSYRCECLPGFKDLDTAHPGKKCEDIDECKSKELNKCSKYATCTNTLGGYNCTCTDGYEGDGIHCIPRKTCDFNDHMCVKDARCVPCNENNQECYKTANRPAYYQCHCPIGFIGDGLKNGTGCSDINECENENVTHICGDHAKCVNLPGKYECVCDNGYSLIARYGKHVCVNINECLLRKGIDKGAHDCNDNAICHDTDGSFECICKNGFETDPVFKGHTDNGCIDKRPPEVVPKGDQNMRVSQYSSYIEKGIQILHTRNDNYKHKYHVEWDPALQYEYLLDVGYFNRAVNYTVSIPNNLTKTPIQTTYRNVEIVDINECAIPKDKFPKQFHPLCHPLADCINLNGSYSCQCREGYQCKDCDGFMKEAVTRNWKDEPWYNHKPIDINGGTGCIDTKPPIISLKGQSTVEISLCKCGTLIEQARMPSESELCKDPKNGKCFTAYDENDGDLTDKVKVTHRQLDNKTWEYNYTVSDAAGNVAPTIHRRVQVVDLDLANEMKIRKLLDEKLSHKVSLLNYRVNEHSKAALFIVSIIIVIITSCLMIFGLFWKVYYMFLYIISPVALMSNKIGFEMGMDTYLRVRSLGAMNDLERKRRIIAQWTELYDIINGQDDSDGNNNRNDDSSRSVSENEEEDDDRDTHLGDSSRDSINSTQDDEEEEGEEDEEE